MQRPALSIICLFVLSAQLLAQSGVRTSNEFTVEFSPPYPTVRAYAKLWFNTGQTLLSVKLDRTNATLITHDATTLALKKLNLYKDVVEDLTFEGVIDVGGRYYFTYSTWDKKNERIVLYKREIDVEAGEFKGEGSEMLHVDGRVTANTIIWGLNVTPMVKYFSFHYPHDRSKVVVQYRHELDKKIRDTQRCRSSFICFGPDLDQQWARDLELPSIDAATSIEGCAVGAEGNVYILALVNNASTGEKRKNEENQTRHIELMRLDPSTGDLAKVAVDQGGRNITGIQLHEAGDGGGALCAGTYNSGSMAANVADGIFWIKVDKTGNASTPVFHEIPLSIVNEYAEETERARDNAAEAKGEAGLHYLVLRNLAVDGNGTTVIVCEQFYEWSSTGNRVSGSETTTTFKYLNILATRVKADGSLAWMRKLPKDQMGQMGRSRMGFSNLSLAGGQYFFFHDNEKNMAVTPDQVTQNYFDGKDARLSAYRIDDISGEVIGRSLFDTEMVNGTKVSQCQTDRIHPLSPDTFIVEVNLSGKEEAMVRVTMDD